MHYQSADSCWSTSYNNSSTTTSTMSSSVNVNGITYHVNDPAAAAAAAAAAYSNNIERLIERLASENAVVIFSISSCCMCHAIKRLFCGMGVNPTVYELDQDPNKGRDIEKALMKILFEQQGSSTSSSSSSSSSVPVVFIGGKLVGPMDRVMASHINGSLVPLLKSAGALWL